jgi:hypothetical protein
MDQSPDSAQNFPEWPSEAWIDPIDERTKLRVRLQRFRIGFSLIGVALLVYCVSLIIHLVMIFQQQGQPLGVMLGIPYFDLIEGAIITWGSLLGVCMICGNWPDIHWQRRSGILLMMCLADAVIWSLDHAGELGLSDGKFGHEWFREALATALGWSEFALIATLAGDLASHQGEAQANDLARSARSLATTSALLWFLYFTYRTDWIPPIWPLRARMLNLMTFMLSLAYHVLLAIILVQTTSLCLLASRCCGRTLREMALADHANDVMPSRSEDGWEEMIRKSDPKDGV